MTIALLPEALFPSVIGFVAGVASSQVGSALHIAGNKDSSNAKIAKVAGFVFNAMAFGAYVGATIALLSNPITGLIAAGITLALPLACKITSIAFGPNQSLGKYTTKLDAIIELGQKVAIVAISSMLATPYLAAGTFSGVVVGIGITLLPAASLACDDTVKLSLHILQEKITALFHRYNGW
jgi:hypothetical protein